MKVSRRWLMEYAGMSLDAPTICERLTGAGLEVEGCHPSEFIHDDQVLEINITPNRGDCLSVAGLAREITAISNHPHPFAKIPNSQPETHEVIPVEIAAPQACPRYVGRIISNISTTAKTPTWMMERLNSSGIRTIYPVVDIMNYVMLEMGQPLHAFDLAKIHGDISVRFAKAHEKLMLLDGVEITLDPSKLVIADHKNILALAGMMGGLDSGVSELTQNIFLESAFFSPDVIRGRGRSYHLQSDSQYRFERGVDPTGQVNAIHRATELILQIVGGKAGPIIEKTAVDFLPKKNTIELRAARVEKVLGVSFSDEEIENILKRLDMQVKTSKPGEWEVTVGAFRFDVTQEIDLIEEICRIAGYQNIPSKMPTQGLLFFPQSEKRAEQTQIMNVLIERGFHEAITYSFVDPNMQSLLNPEVSAIPLLNPISSALSEMRTTLWSSLMEVLIENIRKGQSRVFIFEIGSRFIGTPENFHQEKMIAGCAFGPRFPEQWGFPTTSVDFFDVKGCLETIFTLTHKQDKFKFVVGEHPALHPGKTAKILRDEKVIGWIGELAPRIQHQLDIPQPVILFELEYDALLPATIPTYQPYSKYPAIRRDLAFWADMGLSYDQVTQSIKDLKIPMLQDCNIFDLYQGKGVPEGKKSMALAVILQNPMKTLVDAEVQTIMNQVIDVLKTKHGMILRES